MIQSDTEQVASGLRSPDGEQAEKMDPALKAKWVEALRSGEYKQTRLNLRDSAGFCCVGVFCEVAGIEIEGHNRCKGSDAADGYSLLYNYLSSAALSELIAMNDGEKRSFPEIANFIEANL